MMEHSIQREQNIAITEVPDVLPRRNGKKVHYSTVYRWCIKGARGRVLQTFFVGGIRYTSIEALQRFLGNGSLSADRIRIDSALRALRHSTK